VTTQTAAETVVQDAPNGSEPVLRAAELEIRPAEFLVLAGGRPVAMTARELDLLTALMQRPDRIISRDDIYRVVWGDFRRKSDRSVDVYVGRIRHKLWQALPERRFIHTHFGFGYRFKPEPSS
jgi:DNA-binding response OmpR family regulator